MLGRDQCQSVGGGGMLMVHLSCNDRHRLAIHHFAENEQNIALMTLDGSRYIYILIYSNIWGIVGCVIDRAFVVLTSKLTNNGYLTITDNIVNWQTLVAFKC